MKNKKWKKKLKKKIQKKNLKIFFFKFKKKF